jgi:hypothetical protein
LWAALICGVGWSREAAALDTYYIDESTDYTGNGCAAEDLDPVTSTFRTALDNSGWSGSRFTNANAWPEDFMESCATNFGTGGLDSVYADSKTLAVFAGHGNKGLLAWGFKHNNRCTVDFSSNMRLGSMGGARAGYAIYISCCTLNTGSLVAEANFQWLFQQFGYHNEAAVGENQLKEFWNAIDSSTNNTNREAWLSEMEDKPGLFTGDNSPIVVAQGESSSACTNELNNKVFERALNGARGNGPECKQEQPHFFYCYSLRNNGGCDL